MNDILTVLKLHALDTDFIRFLSTTTYYHKQKNRFEYDKQIVPQKAIYSLWYKECFKHIILEIEIPDPALKPKKVVLTRNFDLSCQEYNTNIIPKTVTKLDFGIHFNQDLYVGLIPPSVITLHLGLYYNRKLEKDYIPFGVKKLIFGFSYRHILDIGDIPKSVEKLYFPGDSLARLGAIPNSVRTLRYGCENLTCLYAGTIPNSVKKLIFSDNFRQTLQKGDIPFSVETLIFGYTYTYKIDQGVIPTSIKKIRFGILFNMGLYWEKILPISPGVIWEVIISRKPKKKLNIPNGVILNYVYRHDIL